MMTGTESNRTKVLEMLKNGTVTVEQAEALLERLNEEPQSEPAPAAGASGGGGPAAATVLGQRPVPTSPRYLRVAVNSPDGDRVNIRVPMALIRTGIKLSTLIPHSARESVQAQGIDLDMLTSMDPDELVRALAEMTVDVESKDGATVQIFCE